eukprot:1194907-Prorocentrum_minimum.AAC.2
MNITVDALRTFGVIDEHYRFLTVLPALLLQQKQPHLADIQVDVEQMHRVFGMLGIPDINLEETREALVEALVAESQVKNRREN